MRQNVNRGLRNRSIDGDQNARGAYRPAGPSPEEWLDELVAELDPDPRQFRDDAELAAVARRLADYARRRRDATSPPFGDLNARGLTDRQAKLRAAAAAILNDERADASLRSSAFAPGAGAAERDRGGEPSALVRERHDAVSTPSPAAASRAEHLVEALRRDVSGLSGRLENLEPARREIERLKQSVSQLAGRHDVTAFEKTIRVLADRIDQTNATIEDARLEEARRRSEPEPPTRAEHLFEALRMDVSVLADKLEDLQPPHGEIQRLHQALGHLAGREDITALEKSIWALAERLDQAATRGAPQPELEAELGIIRQKLDDVCLAVDRERIHAETDTALAIDFGMRLDLISHKLDIMSKSHTLDIANQIDVLADKIEALNASPGMNVDLRPTLEDLSWRIDDALSHASQSPLAGSISERLDEIAALMRHQSSPDITAIEDQIRALAENVEFALNEPAQGINERLDNLTTFLKLNHKPQDTRALEDLIRALSAKIEALEPGTAQAFGPAIDRLSQKIDNAFSQPAQGINDRLDNLAALVKSSQAPQGARNLEHQISALSRQIDAAHRGDTTAAALDALQNRMTDLAGRLDQTGAAQSLGSDVGRALNALERTMNDMGGHLEALRKETSQVAQRAARMAVAETLSSLPAPAASADRDAAIESLKAERLKASEVQAQAERSTRGSLEAMHGTLARMAERLGATGARSAERQAEADKDKVSAVPPPAAETPQAPLLSERAAARSGAVKSEPGKSSATRTPPPRLEPASRDAARSGGPRADGARATPRIDLGPRLSPTSKSVFDPLGPAPVNPGPDRGDVKASFIAAARRAAQAAMADATTVSPQSRGRAAEMKSAKRDLQPADGRGKRIQKPVLMAAAALVVAAGVTQIYVGLPLGLEGVADTFAPRQVARPDAQAALPKASGDAKAASQRRDVPANPFVDTVDHTGSVPGQSSAARNEKLEVAKASADAKTVALSEPAAEPKSEVKSETKSEGKAEIAPPGKGTRIEGMGALKEVQAIAGLPGLRQAALSGDPAAVYDLAARVAEGRGLPRDLSLAAKIFEKAAEFGLAPAQYRLGGLYEKGVGVARDPALARKWYERAAEQGNAKSMHNLAVLLAEGMNGKPDYATAADWFRRAAEFGVRDSQYNFAILLARGLGLPQNLVQSYIWFAVAAANGDDDAGKKRDEVGGRLSAAELQSAKISAEQWQAKVPDAAANDVSLPAAGWEPVTGAAVKPPVKDKPAKGSRV